jgi:hypothetical protein
VSCDGFARKPSLDLVIVILRVFNRSDGNTGRNDERRFATNSGGGNADTPCNGYWSQSIRPTGSRLRPDLTGQPQLR